MKILFENISDILNDKVTVYQRGLLITLLLLKEDDPKLTLAKFKAKVNMKEAKLHLMMLHEMGFVKWSGYNAAKKSIENAKVQPDVVEAITFMNKLEGIWAVGSFHLATLMMVGKQYRELSPNVCTKVFLFSPTYRHF